jgi:hypothetical protein
MSVFAFCSLYNSGLDTNATMKLFSRHPLLLQTAFSELRRQAVELSSVLVGTPGSVGTREVNGRRFLYRQFYDAEGRKAAQYIGSSEDQQARRRADAIREQIVLTNALVKDARLLSERGYVRTEPRTGAIVAVLANRGLFRAGAVLVGSHAYGALLNDLGVRAASFATEDVAIARADRLELALAEDDGFAKMLADSTVRLDPVRGFDRKTPATSYKAPGKDRLRVDLLVPSSGREVSIKPVPELRAHATALPHLRYLLTDTRDALLLGREGVIPVRVPRPEAFAWHKMLVSQLRGGTSEKRAKDILQATVLFAVLAEDAPDALESAFADIPRTAKTKTLSGARQVLSQLDAAGHERASELMKELV